MKAHTSGGVKYCPLAFLCSMEVRLSYSCWRLAAASSRPVNGSRTALPVSGSLAVAADLFTTCSRGVGEKRPFVRDVFLHGIAHHPRDRDFMLLGDAFKRLVKV